MMRRRKDPLGAPVTGEVGGLARLVALSPGGVMADPLELVQSHREEVPAMREPIGRAFPQS